MGLTSLQFDGIFISPEQLIERFDEYIQWLNENKLKEAKLYGSEGEVAQLDRMRIPSEQGFRYYLRTTKRVFDGYRAKGLDWQEAFSFIEESMYAISFEGASAGLLKESIVMRKLGMADKIEQVSTQKRVVILHTPDNKRAYLEAESID